VVGRIFFFVVTYCLLAGGRVEDRIVTTYFTCPRYLMLIKTSFAWDFRLGKRNAEPLDSDSDSGILKLGWGMQRWPVVDLECEPFIRKPPMIPLAMLRLEPVVG